MYTTSSYLHLTTQQYFSTAESNTNLLLIHYLKGFMLQIFQNFLISGVILHSNLMIAAMQKLL